MAKSKTLTGSAVKGLNTVNLWWCCYCEHILLNVYAFMLLWTRYSLYTVINMCVLTGVCYIYNINMTTAWHFRNHVTQLAEHAARRLSAATADSHYKVFR